MIPPNPLKVPIAIGINSPEIYTFLIITFNSKSHLLCDINGLLPRSHKQYEYAGINQCWQGKGEEVKDKACPKYNRWNFGCFAGEENAEEDADSGEKYHADGLCFYGVYAFIADAEISEI